MGSAASPPSRRRLIVVCGADETGGYDWLPSPRAGDVTVTLDAIAHADIAGRRPISFDQLQGWQERNATEHQMTDLLAELRSSPAVTAAEVAGHRLIDFAEYRLRIELGHLLRGWTLTQAATGAQELLCDPAAPSALRMGARAGLGLDPDAVPYTTPPELPGSRLARVAMRPVMRVLASVSRPARARVAAVATGKLMLALDSLSDADLRALNVATMPFPGLDYGNSAILSLRRRLPLLKTFGSARRMPVQAIRLPERLELGADPRLDGALCTLTRRLLEGATPELARAVAALGGLEMAPELRALLLPSGSYGASRLLIEWARAKGIRVGIMQHGMYAYRNCELGDQFADLVFSWGEGTAEQVGEWSGRHPDLARIGVPGTSTVATRRYEGVPRHALIATSNAGDTPICPATFCEMFMDVIAPGLSRLAQAGVRLTLRPHPNENPARYRRLLSSYGLDVEVAGGTPFAAAVAETDILISSASSVAFEAGALGLPVLMWLGPAPLGVREEHLVAPWVRPDPGLFERVEDFSSLADDLIAHPVQAFTDAHELARRLARYAQPFESARFADGIRMLAG